MPDQFTNCLRALNQNFPVLETRRTPGQSRDFLHAFSMRIIEDGRAFRKVIHQKLRPWGHSRLPAEPSWRPQRER